MITNETLIRSFSDDELITAYHNFELPPFTVTLTTEERVALELIEMEIDARNMHL